MNFVRSKVVAIVLTLAMVFSVIAMPVVNAEEVTTQKTAADAAQFLQDNALLLGDNGDLGLENELTRAEMMVVMARLMQEEEVAATFATEGLAFTDVTGWAAPYVAWAVSAGITKGTGANTFGPNDKVTGQQAKAFFLRALGYDVAWEEISIMADEYGISNAEVEVAVADDQPILRGDMATMMFNTVYTETADGAGVLGEQLGVIEVPSEENAVPVLSDVKASAEATAADTVDVTGKVEPATATVTVGTVDAVVAEDGTFKATVTLDKAATDGVNNFEVVATNVDQTANQTVTVKYAGALEISAAVVSDTAIKVTFNRAVLDTTKLAFELKGVLAVATVATWNAEKTEALLTAPSILLEGAYTVKATGDTFATGKDSATFVVVKNGIAKIEILSEKLVQASATTGTIKFKLSDNYGKDITEAYSSDVSIVSSVGNGNVTDPKKGVALITRTANSWAVNPATPETVAVTVIGKTTAVTAAKTLTVADISKVDAVTFKDVTFQTTTPVTTKVLTKKAIAAYIPIEAKDQYGDDVTTISRVDSISTSEVYYVSSDSAVTVNAETYTDNTTNIDKVKLVVNTSLLTVAKPVTITAISKLSGKTAFITLSIQEAAKPDKLTVLAQEKMTAEADKAGEFVLPIKAFDQYGVELTPDEIIANQSSFIFGGDFRNVAGAGATTQVRIETTGVNKGKIVNVDAMPVKGTKVLTINISGASAGVGTYTVDVKEKAYPKTIKLDQAPAQNLLDNASTKMYYQLVDQYGRKMELAALNLWGATYQVKLTVTGTDYATFAGVTTGSAIDVDLVANKAVPITITGKNVEGTSRIKAELYDKDSTTLVVSSVDTPVTTVAGVPGTLTIDVADIPVLAYSLTDGTDDVSVLGADPQARPIIITAKDAGGNTYALPSSRILNVSVSDATVLAINSPTTPLGAGVAVKALQNKFAVAGLHTAFATTDAEGTTKTATIKVLVSTDAGPREVVKTVTVKKEVPKVVTVKFYDNTLDPNEYYAMPSDAVEVASIVGRVQDIDASAFYIASIDQYGVYSIAGNNNLKVVNADRVTGLGSPAVIAYDAATGTLTAPTATYTAKLKRDSDIYLMYVAASNAYGTIMIKATDSFTELIPPTVTATSITGNVITLAFSESMDTTGLDVAAEISAITVKDAAEAVTRALAVGVPSDIVWSNSNKTVTITLQAGHGIIATDKITVTTLTDVAGNATNLAGSADVTF